MAHPQISLMGYLQKTLPDIGIQLHGQSKENTTNHAYNANDVQKPVNIWQSFSLQTILNRWRDVLNNASLDDDCIVYSPPKVARAEPQVRTYVAINTHPLVRRALRSGFAHLQNTGRLRGRTVVSYGDGEDAALIENYKPDIAYFDDNNGNQKTRANRAPGDIKPSFKWSTRLQNSPDPTEQWEFHQVLSQVNWYMKQHHARYGVIVTDEQLVAIQRLDYNGRLLLSEAIPITRQGGTASSRSLRHC